MSNNGPYLEVLKAVFPLLEGKDLASCMLVSRQWREVASDDYLWKCLCSKAFPSFFKRRPSPSNQTFHNLYKTFSRRQPRPQPLPPPNLSFDDLELYVDLWSEDALIFSEAVSGSVFRSRSSQSDDYKLVVPVDPRFSIPSGRANVSVSVLAGRRDLDKVACVVNRSVFDYVDGTAFRALAYDYLCFSPVHPFVNGVRAWVSLLFVECGKEERIVDVFGIEIDFCDAASSETEVLWLLDMLDWK
ncbi:F-box protein [Acorus calamus]|uniref:F-box protein n=1 Tax=Acorus calamus TaxID=4465 RepID=A0AAV9CUQ7_ACOCL|nr:F-box protein [Acorus calamus]